jgi:hypothetical protein
VASWAMVDQGLDHAIMWRFRCFSQDIVTKHEEDQWLTKVMFKM